MWRIIIQCSAESWRNHAKDFEAIASQYPATPLSSKKMKDDERRILEYRLENVSDAEEFVEACTTLDGFSGTFESL
jgi:outer membrane protein assembly factor BamD (BamD/ComL family)